MCDTFVATPEFTANGNMIFGKNSDREPNEAQALVRIPAAEHRDKTLQLSFMKIPQVRETYEVIISKPFHMWGAEMGANEHGLCIGNEAVFTKIKFRRSNTGLTGMDMLRLALERTRSSPEALSLITSLIEKYGQDACGGYENKKFYYSSSFIIADAEEAWLLETADRHWAAKKISGFRSISNGLTIDGDYDFCSRDLIDFAHASGWTQPGKDFSFRKSYSDKFYTYFSYCRARQALSTRLGNLTENFSLEDAISILRSHGKHDNGGFDPAKSDMTSLCLHATGIRTPSQTTGSMAAEIRKTKPSEFWFTGTSSPCLSIFKPFYFPGKTLLSESTPQPGPAADGSLWWRHERFHRKTIFCYKNFYPVVEMDRKRTEKYFMEKSIPLIKKGTASTRDKFSHDCINESLDLLAVWESAVNLYGRSNFHPLYGMFWKKNNRGSGIPGNKFL